MLTCKRCGYQWEPRIKSPRKPKRCPKCISPYWNKPYTDRTKRMVDRVREQKGSYA